jgi:hypothetical protein
MPADLQTQLKNLRGETDGSSTPKTGPEAEAGDLDEVLYVDEVFGF